VVSVAPPRLAAAAAWIRAHGATVALELLFNFIGPYLIYDLADDRLGTVGALMAASAPPIVWSVIGFVRERKVDAISIMVLGGIALSLLAFVGGGGVKVLQLRENLVSGLVGLIFLGSTAIRRPLILHLAQAGARRQSAKGGAVLEAAGKDPAFRRDMALATLVWGFGLLAVCAVNCALVFVLTIKQFLLVSSPIGYAGLGIVMAWTFWFMPRAVRRALVRAGTIPAAP
jgi:hypothetical protein